MLKADHKLPIDTAIHLASPTPDFQVVQYYPAFKVLNWLLILKKYLISLDRMIAHKFLVHYNRLGRVVEKQDQERKQNVLHITCERN